MIKKKILSWAKVFSVVAVLLVLMVASISAMSHHDAYAVLDDVFLNNTGEGGTGDNPDTEENRVSSVSAGDWSAVKQNVLFKSIYSNLQKCYSAMQSPITKDAAGVWAGFNSDTYFVGDARTDVFLRFPYGVGDNNVSSCPKMITGWNNNWFTNFFTAATGDYSGLLSMNHSVTVPEENYSESNATLMPEFLTNIGYEGVQGEVAASGRKCFYLQLQLNNSIAERLAPTEGDRPASLVFHTPDYCADLDSNGNLTSPASNAIIRLVGNSDTYHPSEYDEGHLTNENNIFDPLFLSGGGAGITVPTWYGSADVPQGNYLVAVLSGANFIYKNNQGVQSPNNHYLTFNALPENQEAYTNSCSDFGYQWCLFTTENGKKLKAKAISTPGASINYSTLKNNVANLFRYATVTSISGREQISVPVFSSVSVIDYNPTASLASFSSFKKGDSNESFLNYFIGDTSKYNSGNFKDAEKYVLYYTYLKDFYNTVMFDVPMSNAISVKWWNETTGVFEQKYLTGPGQNADKAYYILSDGKWAGQTASDWTVIANLLANIDPEKAFGELGVLDGIIDTGVIDPDGGEEPTAETVPCLATSGSLGWILCPALDIISGATQVIYNNIVENWLTITTNEVGDATERGWGMVRDFANIIFVIALVVVVLSQVTGIGLSNYGIKKMLPTLIMVAVLVNLSFIFCELAVDLSNIVGAGINDLFNEATSIVSVTADFNDIMTGIVGGAGMGIFTTAVAAGGILWGVTNPGVWLPPLLLTLVACLISVIFFFILLAVRKAGVIVLIVLAPVAIVCYALPNTKKFFDRWKKMFIALLMFYPICGLMMGGSKFVSALLKNSDEDGIMYNLVAMLIQVVPFFFIPTVLRGSLQAMGNIGAKLSGLGQRWSNNLTGRMRNAETFKDWQSGMRFNDTERQKKMASRLKNNRFLGKAATWASNTRAGKAIGAANQRANARAITAYQKRLQEAEQADYIAKNTTAESIQAGLDAMRLKQQQMLVDNAMSRMVSGQVVKDADGNEIKIDTTNISGDYDPTKDGSKVDPSSLEGLLRKFMKEYDESGGQDEEKLVQAKAIMQLMISRGGDKGQTAVIRTLEEMSHDANGNGMRTDSTTALGKFATNYDNGKLMSKLKSTDQAGFAMVNDLASENQNIKSLNEYASRVAKNISPEQIPNLSQRAFDTIELARQRGLYDDTTAVGDAARADLNRFTTAYRNAMNNPRIADSIKDDDLEHLNNANAIMQGKRYEDWAKGEWAKDEWRQDEFLRDQMRESKWRAANGKAANYQLSDVEKGVARRDYANLSAADEATALAGRSTMSEADKAAALSSYQDMSGAEIAAAKAKYVGSMTDNDVATAKAKYTNNDYVQRTGDIAKLERGKEVKVPRARASYPDSWRQDNSGQWVDISTGRQLTSDEQEYIEEVRKFNRRIDVENSTLQPQRTRRGRGNSGQS